MANNEEHPPHGNEWEVVSSSLTSSAYAASPGPYNVEARDARKYDAFCGAETSRDLFMSDHFVFPPSEHENLPIDEHLFEEEQTKVMLGGQGLSDKLLFQDEQSIYGESVLGSESSGTESAMYEPGLINDAETNEYAEGGLDLRSDTATKKSAKKSTHNLPSGAWWKRRAVAIYSHTREANAIWSLCFAAAVTGLVVLGQRWQQERWQILQLKWQSSISSEKLSRVFEPLSRLKDVIVRSSNTQASLVRSGSSSDI